MVNNAFHIGDNTTARRVLVEHADGTETVEEIKNDLTLKAHDKADAMERLVRAQGLTDAKDIGFTWATEDKRAGGGRGTDILSRRGGAAAPSSGHFQSQIVLGGQDDKSKKQTRRNHAFYARDVVSSEVGALLSKQVDPVPSGPVPPPKQTNGQSLANLSSHGQALKIIDSIKSALMERGVRGITGLSRRYRIMDDDQ
jgi:hypothetical protein